MSLFDCHIFTCFLGGVIFLTHEMGLGHYVLNR